MTRNVLGVESAAPIVFPPEFVLPVKTVTSCPISTETHQADVGSAHQLPTAQLVLVHSPDV